jgi:hypothetical protein
VTTPIRVRAHSLLCLQGFRGRGYSPEFVRAMNGILAACRADAQTPVQILDSPDDLCAACPNLAGGGCTLGGPDHEDHMRRQDREVLRRLGLTARTVVPWRRILERIAGSVRGNDLPAICTTCPWLPLGWCAEGIDALREA